MVGHTLGRAGEKSAGTAMSSGALSAEVMCRRIELKDIQLPDSMKRAMARQAEAEREKRAKIIAAEGESMAAAALGAPPGPVGGVPVNFTERGKASETLV